MEVDEFPDGRSHCRKKGLLAKLLEEPEPFEFVLDRILHFRENQFDADIVQSLVVFGHHIRGRHIEPRDGLGGHDQPAHRRGRCRDCLKDTLLKELRVCKKQRRIQT